MIAGPRGAAAGLVATALLLAAPALRGVGGGDGIVLAHAQLVASSPGAGSVLPQPPAELRLVFSEPLEDEVTSIDLALADGTPVLDRAGEVDPEDPFALVVDDPGLSEGVYRLTWRTLSAVDGHTAEGFLTFGIGDVAGELAATGDGHETHTETDPLGVASRWLTYAGLLAALGLAVFVRLVLRERLIAAPLRRLVAAALVGTAAATLALALAAGLEAGAPIDYLTGTRNGLLLLARAAVAALGAAALILAPARLALPIAAAAGLAGIVLLAVAGHASAVGPAAVAAGIVHVACVAVWLGGVAGLLIALLRPGWLGDGQRPNLRTLVPRFSALALVSIGFVVATGAYAAWVNTGSLLPPGTDYGRSLLLKTGLAVAAFALGGLNFLDGGRMKGWLDGMRTRLKVEGLLAATVLVMSAVLASTPPVEETAGVEIAPVPDAFGEVAPGMGLEIVPGRPGVNRVVVRTNAAMASVDRMELGLDGEDGSSTRVPLVLEGMEGAAGTPGMDHTVHVTPADDGTIDWNADAIVLPAGSSWDASVRILAEDGTELSRQRFAFGLSDDGIATGRAGSWLTWGTVVAALLAVGGALGLGLGLGGATLPHTERGASRLALTAGGTVGVALGALIGLAQLVG